MHDRYSCYSSPGWRIRAISATNNRFAHAAIDELANIFIRERRFLCGRVADAARHRHATTHLAVDLHNELDSIGYRFGRVIGWPMRTLEDAAGVAELLPPPSRNLRTLSAASADSVAAASLMPRGIGICSAPVRRSNSRLTGCCITTCTIRRNKLSVPCGLLAS
ncbi:MAG: hypothetical protein ACT4O1_07270 [Gemmatimonadota bacterium]